MAADPIWVADGLEGALAPILKAIILGASKLGRNFIDLGIRNGAVTSTDAGRIGVAVSTTLFQSSRSSGRSFLAMITAPKPWRAHLE